MSNEMHSLLGKYFNGEATAEETAIVKQWMEASEENRADFLLLQKLWNKSGEHQEMVFDTNKAWQSVQAKLNTSKAPAKTINMFTRRTAIAAAASVIVLLGLWWLAGQRQNTVTIHADVGVKEVRLEDGSAVFLRDGSSLTYSREFDKGAREVKLTGEAFFDVTPDPGRPFRIEAAQAAVEVVGTSFSVNTNDNRVELIVKTGRVKFGANTGGEVVFVGAGERAMLAQNAVTKTINADINFDAWQSKQLVFNNTPLPEAAKVLSDHYKVNITLKKEDSVQLSAAAITARFNDQSLASVLEEIALITSYRVQRLSEGNYEISIK